MTNMEKIMSSFKKWIWLPTCIKLVKSKTNMGVRGALSEAPQIMPAWWITTIQMAGWDSIQGMGLIWEHGISAEFIVHILWQLVFILQTDVIILESLYQQQHQYLAARMLSQQAGIHTWPPQYSANTNLYSETYNDFPDHVKTWFILSGGHCSVV